MRLIRVYNGRTDKRVATLSGKVIGTETGVINSVTSVGSEQGIPVFFTLLQIPKDPFST